MENIKKNKIIYIFICIIIVILCVIILFFLDKKDASSEDYNYLEISEKSINSNTTENNNTEVQNNIYIHIMGEIKNPGVVIAKEGDRIKDIIEKAGGTTEKADLKNINLAYKVEDGQKINIPNIDENKNENVLQEKDDEKNKSTTNNTNNKNAKNVNHITKSSGTNVIVDGNNNDAESKSSKVNINTATQTELETLNGIGPSTASKIIKYRNEKGKFKKIEDIKNVSGIGEAKFKKIEADIVV